MLEALGSDLDIELVGRVLQASAHYVPPATLPDAREVEPFVDVARRFGAARDEVLVRAADGLSSAELSAAVLRSAAVAQPEPYRWLLLAQNEADRDAALAPLARLHEQAAPRSLAQFGLTHLDANAAVDALALLAWLLSAGEQALLVLTDQQILAPRTDAGRLPAGEGSVALRVRRGTGRLRVLATGQAHWPQDAFGSGARFNTRLAEDLELIRRAHPLWSADHVVVQNVFAQTDPRPCGDPLAAADFGAGDVWHRLGELLAGDAVGEGERVLLVATGGIRRVSYALLQLCAAAGEQR